MKRILRLFAAAVMALCLCVPTASAAGAPTLSLSSGQVTAGGEVELTLAIENNPGLAAIMVYVYYDTSAFTVDPSRDISAEGSFASSGGMMNNSISTARQNGRYDGEEGKDGVLALWYNSSGRNVTGDGAMMSVRLQTKAGVPNGSYEIGIGYSKDNARNEKLEEVTFSTVSGTVTVSGGSNTPQTPPSTTPPESTAPDGTKPETTPPVNPNPGTTPGTTTPGETVPGGTKPGTTTPGGTTTPVTPSTPTAPAAPEDKNPAVLFSDVSGNWAEESIKEAANRGLIVGDQGLYRPNDTMSRAELVTILWRANGSPAPAKAASFTDLTQDWYKDAVAWAESTGVVNGVGGGKFDPIGNVSREQLAAVLHRMAGSPTGMEAVLSSVYDGFYPDSGAISGWAKQSLYWAVFSGIYCGENDYTFSEGLAPGKPANRAQIAVMIVHYLDKNQKSIRKGELA